MHLLDRDGARGAMAALACGLVSLAYFSIYLPFLPTAAGTVGHDYSLQFPNLLAGFYWHLQNGLLAIPWYSPAQCGGFPYFPDLNAAYVSVPQLLVFAVSPMRAVQITFVLFALLGTYVLVRQGFAASRPAAVLAAGLFLFNGFFTYRVLIGHLTYHAFALTPVMIAALLPSMPNRRPSCAGLVVRAGIAGLCLAYMFQAGFVHGIPPVLLATVIVILIHALCFGWRWQPWGLLAASGALALALCAGKLVAALALLSNFPRNDYPLPGVADLPALLWAVVRALFASPPPHPYDIVTNTPWRLDRHEWEEGVSIVPAVFLVAAAIIGVLRRHRQPPLSGGRLAALTMMLVLLSLPVAVNWYQPAWNGFLKSLLYFGNSSSLLRFFCAYVPVVILAACLAFDRLLPIKAGRDLRPIAAGLGLCVAVLQNAVTDRSYYAGQHYQIAPIEEAYARAAATRTAPAIIAIGVGGDPALANDAMIEGRSRLDCYQPLFGYRLEAFPMSPLQAGSVFDPVGDHRLNLKNPACYLFPAENACRPGDHFRLDERKQAEAFVAYRPFAFVQPLQQRWATGLSLTAAIGVMIALAAAGGSHLLRLMPPRAGKGLRRGLARRNAARQLGDPAWPPLPPED